ncbi:MAG: N-acetyltransferase family protein [Patescibacteria group bacterium]
MIDEFTPYSIESLQPTQWREYRDIWLEALKEMPEVFFADYEEQSKQPDEVWKERLNAALKEDDIIVIFAIAEGKPIGFLGAYIDTNPKFRHIAVIWGAFVRYNFRHRGISKAMMDAFMKKINSRPEITKIKTYSVTNERLAVSIFKNYGFELIAIAKNEIKLGDEYRNVYIMEKLL